MIADEIQSGLARSGRMLACDWEEVHPDVLVRSFIFHGFSIVGCDHETIFSSFQY